MIRISQVTRFFLLPLAVISFFAGCGGSEQATDPQAQPGDGRTVRVETLALQPTTFEDEIRLTGTLDAPDDATLSAQTSGTLTILAPLGRFVKAGQTVAQVDPALARAALNQAEAQVAAAQSQFELAADNFRRQEGLYRDSIISALEFQNIRAQRSQAEAGLAQAKAAAAQSRQQLANTRVVAPFSGTVEEHLAERGEQVGPGTGVVRLVSTGKVQVVAGVPERYAADIEVGTPVTVQLNAYGLAPRAGRITFVGAAVDPDNRTFPIEVALDNPGGTLKPEMVAQLVVARERLEGILVVPQAALVRDEAGESVFVVADEGSAPKARRRAVTLGVASGGNVVVTSGLAAGDAVVVLGQSNLTDGDQVEVVESYSSADAAGAFTEAATQ